MEDKFDLVECLKYSKEAFTDEVREQVKQNLLKGMERSETDVVLNKGLAAGDKFTLISCELMDAESKNGDKFKAPVFTTSNGCKVGAKWFPCGSTAGEIADFIIDNRTREWYCVSKTKVDGNNVFVIA